MALAADRIQKPVRKLRKLLKKIPRKPSREEVHDLRANVRRLEAELGALLRAPQRNERRLLKTLGKVRKQAGKVRDMDVLTGFAANIHPDGEKDCIIQLLEHLGAERRKSARNLHGMVKEHRATIRRRLRRSLIELERILFPNSKNGIAVDVTARAMASALKLESELAAPAQLGRQNLHSYRLTVKELHNVLKLASDADGQEFTKTLGEVKDAIGEWHDWEELLAIARDVLDHGPRCKLLNELRRISQTKYHHALADAEQMRKKYLRLPRGKNNHRPPQFADPVWAATKGIGA